MRLGRNTSIAASRAGSVILGPALAGPEDPLEPVPLRGGFMGPRASLFDPEGDGPRLGARHETDRVQRHDPRYEAVQST